MQRKALLKVLGGTCLVVALIALLMVGCAKPAPAPAPAPAPEEPEVTKWVFQPAFGPEDAGWGCGVVPWIEDVEAATKGTIEIELLPLGSICSDPEALPMTIKGVLDLTAGWATNYGGDLPEGHLAYGQSFTSQTWEEHWDILWGDKYRAGELVQEACHEKGIHWVGWCSQGWNSSYGNFEVHKWEDYQGKKMYAGGPQSVYLEAMGGNPVVMPPTEIYMSIKTGILDGTFWDVGGTDDMKYYEVVDNYFLPPWCGSQNQEIFINLDTWNALEQWQRDAISGIFQSNYARASTMHDELVGEAIQTAKDNGCKVIEMSEAEQARTLERVKELVWPKTRELSPRCDEGMDIYMQWMKDHGRL